MDDNLVRLNTIRNEGLKIEAKKYPLKILCPAECKNSGAFTEIDGTQESPL